MHGRHAWPGRSARPGAAPTRRMRGAPDVRGSAYSESRVLRVTGQVSAAGKSQGGGRILRDTARPALVGRRGASPAGAGERAPLPWPDGLPDIHPHRRRM